MFPTHGIKNSSSSLPKKNVSSSRAATRNKVFNYANFGSEINFRLDEVKMEINTSREKLLECEIRTLECVNAGATFSSVKFARWGGVVWESLGY